MKTIAILLATIFTVTAATNGDAVAKKSFDVMAGYGSEIVQADLLLISARKDTVSRTLKLSTLERDAGENYSLIQFFSPQTVKGTSLLTYQKVIENDLQWLYLPGLKRVKKISSGNRSGSFMSSEFSYEDISGDQPEKFTHKLVDEVTLLDQECYLLEKTPNYEGSGYSKIIEWISKESNLVQRREFYDRKASLLKVETFSRYEEIDGIWRVSEVVMENLQTNKSSVLQFSNREVHGNLDETLFTVRNLERVRD